LGTVTPVLSQRFHGEIGQDGGKRASYPGYSVGLLMATKRSLGGRVGRLSPTGMKNIGGKRIEAPG
jgi:hypothetical protein